MIRDPDALRTVWLFSRPYWWDRVDGRLVLKPDAQAAGTPEPPTFEKIADLLGGPLPGPA